MSAQRNIKLSWTVTHYLREVRRRTLTDSDREKLKAFADHEGHGSIVVRPLRRWTSGDVIKAIDQVRRCMPPIAAAEPPELQRRWELWPHDKYLDGRQLTNVWLHMGGPPSGRSYSLGFQTEVGLRGYLRLPELPPAAAILPIAFGAGHLFQVDIALNAHAVAGAKRRAAGAFERAERDARAAEIAVRSNRAATEAARAREWRRRVGLPPL